MKYQLEQERNSAFTNIGKSFFSLFTLPAKRASQTATKPAGYEVVSTEFDKYLKNDLCYFAFELIENGYEPSKKQNNEFIKLIQNTARKDNRFFDEVNKIMKDIPEDLILLAVEQNANLIYSLIKLEKNISEEVLFTAIKANLLFARGYSEKYSEIDTEIVDLVKEHVTEDNAGKLVNEINNNVITVAKDLFNNLKVENSSSGEIGYRNITKVMFLEDCLKNYDNLITILNPILEADYAQKYKDTITTIKQVAQDKASSISKAYNNRYLYDNEKNLKIDVLKQLENNAKVLVREKLSMKKEDIIKQAKILNSDAVLEKKVNHSIMNNHVVINNELPLEAKEIIKDINEKYALINSNNQLNEEDKLEIINLYENRLPQIVKKFLVIDKEYRTELKNVEGKNAERLMIESLDNIYHILEDKLEKINVERLSDLSVSNRYTNAVRNKL